jgi:hypothetical protein
MNPSSLLAYYAPTPNPQDDFDWTEVKPPLRLQPISTTAVRQVADTPLLEWLTYVSSMSVGVTGE